MFTWAEQGGKLRASMERTPLDPKLRDRLDLASLVPDVYAAYRPAVTDAMLFFLEHLPSQRLSTILLEQAALPAETEQAVRLVTLMHECPTLHKLGQVVARHRALDARLRRELQRMESLEPRTPMEAITPIVREELADAMKDSRVQVEETALAEASVAVVVPFEAPSGGGRVRGVLKVLKPGVTVRLNEELEILARVADHLDDRRTAYGLPAFGYRETFETVRELLLHEVQFEREQRNLTAAAARYAGSRRIVIPALLAEYCTARITAMWRIDGVKVTEALASEHLPRRKLADALMAELICDVVFSRDERSLFHADPHAGNLFATQDGRLAVLDWALVGRLSREDRAAIAQMAAGGATLDAGRIGRAIAATSSRAVDEPAMGEAIEAALHEVRRGALPGPRWLMRLLDAAVQRGARFGNELLLFRKTLLTLDGVLADLDEHSDLDAALIAAAMEAFARDWPRRALAAAGSRDFLTCLSNADLASLLLAAPAAAVQWGAMTWREAVERMRAAGRG